MVKIDKNIIIERLNKVHNNTIECNIDEYVNTQIPITFNCKTCGYEWKARPYSVLAGHGCRKCYDKKNSESKKISLEEIQSIIDKSGADITIIGNFIDTKHKALMRCNKCGYEWDALVRSGMQGHGCPKCNSSILEQKVRSRFIMHNIGYEEQKRFPWLGKQSFDFYIPKLNIAIECQGSQHFIKDSFMSDFEGMVERDERKRKLSSENGVRIIYYVPKKLEEFVKGKYEYFTNENDLATYLSAMLAEIES